MVAISGRWAARADALVARLAGRSEPAAATRMSWRTAGLVLALLAAWRGGLLLYTYLLGRLGQTDCGWGVEVPWTYSACWDTSTYQLISARGYDYAPDTPSSIAFFPLYPMVMRYADRLVPGPGDVFASLIFTHLALVVAAFYVFLTVRADFSETIAWRTLFFLLIFPSAWFFGAAYPEAFFLLGVAGCLYHARRGHWIVAGLFGIIAGLTKLTGVLLIVPLVMEMAAQRTLPGMERANPRAWLGALLAPLGTVGYFGWLHLEYGSFRVFFESQENWVRESNRPVFLYAFDRLLGDTTGMLTFYPRTITHFPTFWVLYDALLLVLFFVAGVVLWRQVRPSYGALVIAMCLVLTFSGNPQSINRYVAVLFPVFILLARIRSEPVRNAIALVFVMGLALETYLFVNALWAG